MSLRSGIGSGFDLLKLKIYRFMNYQNPVTFNFEFPHIVISGPTGSGKTTILEALTFVLFGRCSRLELGMVKIEDICGKKGYVRCLFKVGENKIDIKRGRDTRGKSILELFVNKERYSGKIPELNEKIRSTILGMNYKAFVNSTIIRQDEMKSLGSKTSSDRLKTLQNLFRLDIFEKAIVDAQNQLSIMNGKINKIEGKIEEKELQYLKLPDFEKERNSLIPQLKTDRKNLEVMAKTIKQLEDKEISERKRYEEFETQQSKKKDAILRRQNKTQQLKDTEAALKDYLELKKQLKTLENQMNEVKIFEDELNSLITLKKEYDLVNSLVKTLEKKKQRSESIIKEDLLRKKTDRKKESIKIQDLDTTITHEEAFRILNQEGRLQERVQRISKERTWNLPDPVLNEIKEEQSQARKDISDLTTKKDKITKDSFVLSEKKLQISKLDNEITTIAKRLKTEEKQNIEEIQQHLMKLKNINFSKESEKKMRNLESKVTKNKEIQRKYEKIRSSFETKTDPTSRISTINKELEELEKEITKYEKTLKEYPKFLKEYRILANKINEKKGEEKELNNSIIRIDQTIKGIEKKISELIEIKPEIDKLRKSIKSLKIEEDILQKLRTEVFHTRGTPFYAINKILPRLGKRASLILADLTNQRFSYIQLNKIEKGKQGIGFEILIKAPDGIRDVATFSGGERTQINAALRLAISEEISMLGKQEVSANMGVKTLFIDEGDLGSLDTLEAQAAVVKKLFTLSAKFNIILITDLQEIANHFPNSINISRDDYGRSIQANE